MTLGAESSDLLGMILRQRMLPVVPSLSAGEVAAVMARRLISSARRLTNRLTLDLIALVVTSVVLLVCYLPSRPATRVDPLVAPRYE